MNQRSLWRKPLKRGATAAAAAVSSLALLAACGGSGGGESSGSPGVTDDSITVGTTFALTGPAVTNCLPILKGAQAWFKSVNGKGGIDGRKIEYKTVDDAYDAAKAVAGARSLINDGIFAAVGGCGTVPAGATAPIYQKSKVPLLFPAAGLNELYLPPQEYVFALFPLYTAILSPLIDEAFEREGAGTMYIVADQFPSSEEAVKELEKLQEEKGFKIVGVSTLKVGTTDVTPVALKVKAAKPDYVMSYQLAPSSAKLITSLTEQNALPTKLILGPVQQSPAFLAGIDVRASDKILIGGPIKSPSPADSECAAALIKEGLEADSGTLQGCFQAKAFEQAAAETLKRDGDLTRDGLIKTLESFKDVALDSAFSPVTYGPDDRIGATGFFAMKVNGREYVEPKLLSTE